MKDMFEIIGGAIGIVITVLIVMPLITFGCGFLGGLILQFFIGDAVVNGLNVLFGTTRFEPNTLPIVCGALATIASFFTSTCSFNSKND